MPYTDLFRHYELSSALLLEHFSCKYVFFYFGFLASDKRSLRELYLFRKLMIFFEDGLDGALAMNVTVRPKRKNKIGQRSNQSDVVGLSIRRYVMHFTFDWIAGLPPL